VLDTIWQKDIQQPGKATCPKCSSLCDYGTAGIINLVKTHLDKEGCMTAQARKDKQPHRNGSLSSFCKEKAAPIAKFLKPTVRAPSPIQ
jgi:hypothetical protein